MGSRADIGEEEDSRQPARSAGGNGTIPVVVDEEFVRNTSARV
jgi:hypothetical protein